MSLNTDHLARCIETLNSSLNFLVKSQVDTVEYEVFRNATVKGFELTLEVSGKLLRKILKPYFASSAEADGLLLKIFFDMPVAMAF